MMSYIETLRQGRDKSQVAYQEFMLHVNANKDGLFCFFEGKDGSYYAQRINQFVTVDYHPIKCNGKQKVLKVYELISGHMEYRKYKKAFFIDRDFDNPIVNPDIYETPCYAIENFYTSAEVFKKILKNSLGLSEVSEDYHTCMNLYIQRQQEFHQTILEFNAWYACLIYLRNSQQIETGIQLADKLPKEINLSFSLESISANYTIQQLQNTFSKASNISSEMLSQKIKDFSNCEQDKIFRGKYEMEFVVKIIDLIIQDSDKPKKFLKEKITFVFSSKLSNEQAIALFSPYAETPSCLINYLQKFK
jgi:hypothetical protein